MNQTLIAYIPMDRRQALARGATLPEHTSGCALFADISGFTPLAEALAMQLGPQRAAEELTFHLNRVYDALIAQVHAHGGSVIGFVGDAITCWFAEQDVSSAFTLQPSAFRALACALAMQTAMTAFERVAVTPAVTVALSIKVGLAAGPARRFCVGDPAIQRIDVLAGETLRRMSQAEGQARKGEVLADTSVGDETALVIAEWRIHPESGRQLAVVTALRAPAAPHPWPALPSDALGADQARPWVLPALHARPASGARERLPELRPATSLFLRFSGLDYDNDPDAGVKLDAYIRWVQQVVTRYGGNVIQLTLGDKGSFLYAAFGAPIAHGDDAWRAVQAGLALQAPPKTPGFDPGAQIGIACGPARTGEYGSATRRSYGVIGDDAVLAARLMAAAPPGELRCAHSIFTQTRARLTFESLPPVRVKGRVELVQVYRPVSEMPAATSVTPALVGRHAELAQLRAALDAVQSGATRVLFIEGEAGIGKTRLVQALLQEIQERGLTALLGAGQSIEQHTPYRAWRDVFTTYFDLGALSDPAARATQVRAAAAPLAAARERLPLLNALLDLDLPDTPLTASFDPDLRQENLLLLLLALLEAWAKAQPLIVVLEDAHWLDTLAWQLAEQLARMFWVRALPLLLVVVHRPLETAHAGQATLRRLQALPLCAAVRLEGLEPAEIVELVAGRLGVPAETLPPALTTLVQTRSGGNPFFAEELLHALRDRGVLRAGAAAEPPLVLTGDLAQAAQTLPETLHGLILARIDRLPVVQQYLLKVAAVIGRSFAFTPLHATFNRWYAPLPPVALRAELQALGRSDFTFVEALEPELTYIFKHIITQEAAYQTLLFAQRRELHGLVAEWYAAQPTVQPHLLLLVYHYHQAELPAEERRYAGLAGEQAARYYDNANAVGYFTQALALTPASEPEARYALLLGREAVYAVLGERAAQAADIAALATLAAALGDTYKQATVALRQALYARAGDDYPAALAAAQQAVQLASQCGDVLLEMQGLHAWGRILRQQGEFAGSRARLERALVLARQRGNRQEEARSLYDLGTTLYQEADYAGARARYTEAQSLYRDLDHKPGLVQCALMFGALHYQLGEYMAAQEQYRQALAESRAIGWRYAEGFALNSLGNNAFELGDYRAAQEYHGQALCMGREIGHREGVALSLDTLGLIHTMLGEYAQALALGQEALAVQREIEDTYSLGYTLNHLGLAWLGAGEPERAEAVFAEALALRRELGQAAAALDDLAGLARAALARGNSAQAQAYAHEILAHLEKEAVEGMEFPVLVTLTCYRALRVAGECARAGDALALGRRLLEERAAAIHDPALRAQFLDAVPFNRELLQA